MCGNDRFSFSDKSLVFAGLLINAFLLKNQLRVECILFLLPYTDDVSCEVDVVFALEIDILNPVDFSKKPTPYTVFLSLMNFVF